MLLAILRFERKCQHMPNGCRVWTGAQTAGGRGKGPRGGKAKGKNGGGGPYGNFWLGPTQKDTVKAHVFAAFIAGKIPTLRVPLGYHLDHDCDHGPLCVDCTELVPDIVNLQRIHTRPQRMDTRPVVSRLKRDRKRQRSFAASERKLLTQPAL